jgi:hypothetical protein
MPPRKQTITLDQGERVVRARIAGVPVTRIARDEGLSIAEVNKHIDSWVEGTSGPKLRHQEYTLLLARNDELIEFLRVKALAGGANGRNWVREYSAALSRRASLLGLRPPKDVNVRLVTDEVHLRTSPVMWRRANEASDCRCRSDYDFGSGICWIELLP